MTPRTAMRVCTVSYGISSPRQSSFPQGVCGILYTIACSSSTMDRWHDDVENVNLLDGTGKDLHEGKFGKDGIDSDEISSESQVNKGFEFFFVKSEIESD